MKFEIKRCIDGDNKFFTVQADTLHSALVKFYRTINNFKDDEILCVKFESGFEKYYEKIKYRNIFLEKM
jgi:hypothetical protein